ncbi:MAG: phosphoglycerate kinase [Cellvibrionales bacterium TMED122]|nr:phosphoglycerate kinase [Halieaceae bacterium]OUV65297.1 MAG: phosphoglycerate kinase [Cellvibrionales bacterium TMED122]
MSDLDLSGRRVLIRQDLNVPLREGEITNDARLRAAAPSLVDALNQGAAVIVMSHLGRPVEGQWTEQASLAPIAARLSELIGRDVLMAKKWRQVAPLPGDVVLLENVRFNEGEASNDAALAADYAALCDVFVMDAFGTAHRAQASTHGVAHAAPVACAGPLLHAELTALARALTDARRPMLAVVGGSKVSTKLQVLDSLTQRCDSLILGGGIANTFLAAAGYSVGNSLCEWDLVDTARRLMDRVDIPLPVDVVVAPGIDAGHRAEVKLAAEVAGDDMILDVGPETAAGIAERVATSATILWNGPLGVFEQAPFAAGTRVLAEAIAASEGFSLAGGGDTLAAIDLFDVASGVSYISTGGGAFLEYVEGKELPAVAALRARADHAS